MGKGRSKESKEAYCKAYEGSGKSKVDYCKEAGIAPSTFKGWYDRYKKAGTGTGLFLPMVCETRGRAIKEVHDIGCELRFSNETQLIINLDLCSLLSIIEELSHAARALR